MKQILLFGAGKSATILIDYLLENATSGHWELILVDANLALAASKIGTSTSGKAVSFDIMDSDKRSQYINSADVVISMLPPTLHFLVAKDCVQFSKHLLTASYVDEQIRGLQQAVNEKGILFLCEMGLDPGIDHMSAMKIIDEIHGKGGRITSFKSHCGGLVAPESDDNPWHYKISWNPRNIILAGKAGAHYKENGEEIRLTYEELFTPDRAVNIPGIGLLSWYPNRDSLSYTSLYGLEDAGTFIRTTLRHPDFMAGWKNVVDLKLTDEDPLYESDGKNLATLFKEHLDKTHVGEWLRHKMADTINETQKKLVREQLLFLGLNDQQTMVNKGLCSAADILQFAAERKLSLGAADKDMIVMLHEFAYTVNDQQSTINSSLVVKGKDSLRTAMAKTVGLPLGIAAKLILNGTIKTTGLRIPTAKEIYEPVLQELELYGVKFHEEKNEG